MTQFEALTAAAYDELARQGVEVAVIEAGLGGRFDATNVIPSRVQVLTGVGLEHTRWLGPTLTDIAQEKLAVAREGSTLVVGKLEREAAAVAEPVAAGRRARLVVAREPARGPRSCRAASSPSTSRSPPRRRQPFSGARRILPPWRERRRRPASPDGSRSSPSGRSWSTTARTTRRARPRSPARSRTWSAVDGRSSPCSESSTTRTRPACCGRCCPTPSGWCSTRSQHPRSLSPGTLATLAEKLGGPPAESVAEPREAVERARELAGPAGAVVVTGSIYLIADLVRERTDARASTL